jgi:UDP-N-acetylglucosamine--N-acetylmuramyl-(pentapeptide) pyrophosphoryl-undecaprenol N-acetylglucosamine transferase
LVKDSDANEKLVDQTLELMSDESKMKTLSENITKLGISDAAERILKEIEKLV